MLIRTMAFGKIGAPNFVRFVPEKPIGTPKYFFEKCAIKSICATAGSNLISGKCPSKKSQVSGTENSRKTESAFFSITFSGAMPCLVKYIEKYFNKFFNICKGRGTALPGVQHKNAQTILTCAKIIQPLRTKLGFPAFCACLANRMEVFPRIAIFSESRHFRKIASDNRGKTYSHRIFFARKIFACLLR